MANPDEINQPESPLDAPTPTEDTKPIARLMDGTTAQLRCLPAMTKNPELPRQGNCGFIAIPLSTLQQLDEESEARFHREMMGLNRQKGTYSVAIKNDCLIIVNTAERPPDDLASVAISLRKIVPAARVIWGDGEVKHESETDFSITQFPSTAAIEFVSAQEGGTYSTTHLANTISNPSNREAEHLKVSFSTTEHPDIVKVDKVKKLIAPGSNRPDKLIGYEKPLKQIRAAIENPEIKVLIVEAPAGLGKTRLVNEALKGEQFLALANSASLKSRPGGNLARLAEQAYDNLTEDALFSGSQDTDMPLAKFGAQTREEQIDEARKNPAAVTKQIIEAAATMLAGAKRPILVEEDLHHADLESEHSTERVLPSGFLQRFSAFGEVETDSSGLVILTMRGNQMDASPAYKGFLEEVKRTYGEDSVAEVKITDNPLDFTDPEVFEEFAFHGLSRVLRGAQERTDAGAKNLGNWPQELGKIAKALGQSPHVMTTLIDRLEEVAVVTDDAVNIKPNDLGKITAIRSRDDLATVYEESFNRLSPDARTVLFSLALLGGKISQAQFHLIINNLEHEADLEIIEELEKTHYVKQVGENFELSHENVGEFILEQAQNDTSLAQFLLKLQEIFAAHTGEEMHPDAEFALYNNMAKNPRITALGKDFWEKYEEAIDKALANAESLRDIQRGHSIGTSVMSKSGDESPNRILQAAEAMIEGDINAPENQARIAAKALLAIAKNAAYLGKFKESAEATKLLARLTNRNYTIMHPREAVLADFRRAFMQNKRLDMELAFKQLESETDLPGHIKGIMQIQLAYRKRDYRAVRDLYAAYTPSFEAENQRHMAEPEGAPSPDVMNIYILATTRAPYEELREEISAGQDGITVDQDVAYHPNILSPEQRERLDSIKSHRSSVKTLVEQYSNLIDPFNKIATLEVDANLASHEPDLEEAIKCFQESYRQAEKLGVFSQAARAAVLEAKRHVMAATRNIARGKIDIEKLTEALSVFKQRAEISLKLLDDETSPYHEQLHGERLRATGLLCYAMSKTATPISREEETVYIQDALKDCVALFNLTGPEDPEEMYSYYSYLEFVIQAAKKLGLEVPAKILKTIKLEHTSGAIDYSNQVTDRGIGDQTLKELGIFSLRRRIRQHN